MHELTCVNKMLYVVLEIVAFDIPFTLGLIQETCYSSYLISIQLCIVHVTSTNNRRKIDRMMEDTDLGNGESVGLNPFQFSN